MNVDTKACGRVDMDERQRILLPVGLYGFESLTEFVLLDAQQRPFYWLQSLEVRDIAFVLLDPCVIRPDYDADPDPVDLGDLGLSGPSDPHFLQFAIVTVPGNRQEMTANLQGPLVINTETRQGRQCIARDDRWKVRHNVLEEMASSGKDAC